MQYDGVREDTTRDVRNDDARPEDETKSRKAGRLDRSGGLHYHQARRAPGESGESDTEDTAGVRSGIARDAAEPDQRQRAREFGGPHPDDEPWLEEQGYPKLGRRLQSRVTQVEHGPYAGGTQQGDADTKEEPETSG